ncbi:HAD-IC family P-type ATPase [Rarobacter faecitabidus]|uniref:Cation-transporting ATPase E n=1 Tax=Rarobacter faecitabidus TaxID=13243 RepID=A0A542ZW67_RARFA|nr:cation-translocating P-type ATPase [Rarobacter faecitabidus]TQL64539.1 cation-transporting ATPase E [Rarobacter faecitabidus]
MPKTNVLSHEDGLTSSEVAQRVAEGKVNAFDDSTSRSIGTILRANTFTLFNFILATALVAVLITGRWPDAVFGFVMLINIVIGVVTEIRAKRTLDSLAILSAPHAVVTRDGRQLNVGVHEVVLDDIVTVSTGDQVPADGECLTTVGLEVDESLLTGESKPVRKQVGDELLSGSAIVAGTATYRVNRVGADGYVNKLTTAAKKYSRARSELQEGINKILKVISIMLVPIAILLANSQLRATGGWSQAFVDDNWKDAIVAAVAGVVGMIPDGLVLLTSMNFALAAVLLARSKVLVQELPAVEVLARVDVLCLDKTGTITDGTIALSELIDLADEPGAAAALAALAHLGGGNATSDALAAGLPDVMPAHTTDAVPFSSSRKWSAVATPDSAWILGAPEILLAGREDEPARKAMEAVRTSASAGARVILLAACDTLPDPESPLPGDSRPVLVAVLGEHIREDALDTLAYFRRQEVGAKVISGDNPETVAAIATKVDLLGDGQQLTGFDARDLPEDLDELADVLEQNHVFGRVVPEQKRAIVRALQSRGHTVAMTGDGVNDSLALKDADLGIAMGNGAAAAKAVSRIVLLDGKFSRLPGVLGQGRRVMANMERVSTLFLTKSVYSFVLALTVVLLSWPYPFLPRHLTLASSLTIGIPAFLLALPPNNRRYVAGFLGRVLSFAIPIGVILGAGILTSYTLLGGNDDPAMARTATTAMLITAGLWIVGALARPLVHWKIAMLAVLAGAGILAFQIPFVREFFMMEPVNTEHWVMVAACAVGCWILIEAVYQWHQRYWRSATSQHGVE